MREQGRARIDVHQLPELTAGGRPKRSQLRIRRFEYDMPKQTRVTKASCWDVPAPHIAQIVVQPAHIDHMGHVNNAVYLQFMEQTAWAHTQALGLTWQSYQTLDAACVVRRHELDYLAAAFAGDRLQVATWISGNDKRLNLWRGYQIRRVDDGKTLLRAHTHFVCVRLSSGRPRRMPKEFIQAYQPIEQST